MRRGKSIINGRMDGLEAKGTKGRQEAQAMSKERL